MRVCVRVCAHGEKMERKKRINDVLEQVHK